MRNPYNLKIQQSTQDHLGGLRTILNRAHKETQSEYAKSEQSDEITQGYLRFIESMESRLRSITNYARDAKRVKQYVILAVAKTEEFVERYNVKYSDALRVTPMDKDFLNDMDHTDQENALRLYNMLTSIVHAILSNARSSNLPQLIAKEGTILATKIKSLHSDRTVHLDIVSDEDNDHDSKDDDLYD